MAILNSVLAFLGAAPIAVTPQVAAPGSMWHLLILKTFAFVVDYGWRIVVFTVLLKLVLSPLDFYQRYKMNKNQKITERLKPTMEKIQKQYGGDKQAFSQKQMELNRKEGYSYFSSCLPMIATLVVFITLWLSMQTIAEYMTFKEYTTMYDEYQYVYSQIYDPVDAENPTAEEAKLQPIAEKIGQDVVYQMYYYGLDESYADKLRKNIAESEEYKDVVPAGFELPENFKLMRDGTKRIDKVQASFLWIKNIWAPDVPWGDQAILSWDAFVKGVDDYKDATTSKLSTDQQAKAFNRNMYEQVMGKLLNDKTQSRTNGYLILPILVVLLSVASQLLTMYQQKRAGQVNAKGGVATSMKVMMIIMPIMMAIFAVQYASIFALYMTVNSATTLFFNFTFTALIRLIDKRRQSRNHGIAVGSTRTYDSKQSPIIHYVKGANPNAGAREAVVATADVGAQSVKSGKTDGAGKKSKKSLGSSSRSVQRGGRPDPNELMGVD
ncbi:MAG: YidC/Oxa1 family membrane protein insertase, partial [Clostridiales bacterium]|nr:YidC/Oxa1 family membrane protein insertase [Clostridiales bacterium]